MPKARDRGATRAIPEASRRTPRTGTRAARAVDAAITAAVSKRASPTDAISRFGPEARLRTLLVALKQQNDVLAAIEEEGHRLPKGITDASRDQERRLEQALDRRSETLDGIITTPACTPSGLRAKAEALELVALGYAGSQESVTLAQIGHYGGAWDRLALSLARDMLTWEAAL